MCDLQHTKPIQAPPQDPSSFTMLEPQPPHRGLTHMVIETSVETNGEMQGESPWETKQDAGNKPRRFETIHNWLVTSGLQSVTGDDQTPGARAPAARARAKRPTVGGSRRSGGSGRDQTRSDLESIRGACPSAFSVCVCARVVPRFASPHVGTNKQKNRPKARTHARDRARKQTKDDTRARTRAHRRKEKRRERPNQKVHLGRASHLSHP